MPGPHHYIQIDRARKLVDVRIKGFLTPEDAGWVGEDVRTAIRSLGTVAGEHLTLYDVSAMPVVPGATIDLVKRIFGHPEVRSLWARKVAFVTSTALGRLQIELLLDAGPNISVFNDRCLAMEWLLAA